MTKAEHERTCAQLRLQRDLAVAAIVVELVGIDRQPTDEELELATKIYQERALAHLAQRDAAAKRKIN